MTTHALGPVIGQMGGAGAEVTAFSITGTQSMEHTIEVPEGEEWLIVVQVTVTDAAISQGGRLRAYLDGAEIYGQMPIGPHMVAAIVTSTATVELSGTSSNAAHGRIITTKIP